MRRECELLRDTPCIYIRREIPRSHATNSEGARGNRAHLKLYSRERDRPRKNGDARATRGSRVKIGSVPREWRLSVTDAYRHGKRYGSESCPCARRQPRVPGRVQREGRKWRRRSSLSSRIFLVQPCDSDILTERTGRFYVRRRPGTRSF